jgi:hypothetical protein
MAKGSGTTRGNRAATRDRNPNGRAGTYDLYRVGGGKTDSGLAFLGTTFEYADQYTKHYSHEGQSTLKYTVNIENPLVIQLNRDVNKENTYFTDAAYKKLVGGRPSSVQIDNDRALANALSASKYDAILYKGADGKVLEVAISPSKMGKGIKTRESDYFSRTYGQTRRQFIEDFTKMYESWGNSHELARKYALEDARKNQREFSRNRR